MAKRALKVTVEVFPGKTSQTMKVRASGQTGPRGNPLLLGKIRRVAYRQTLTTATSEVSYVSQVLTDAQALVLS